MKHCISRRQLVLGVGLAAHALGRAQATWPSTAIKIIVPAPAGGVVDTSVRVVADQLQGVLGQTVIADNKAGAGGLLAVKAAAQAAPDGHTLIYIHAGLATVQALNPKLDLLKELRPVARLSQSPFMLVVAGDSKIHTLKDLLAALQAEPGKLNYGSGGIGSPAHLAVEQLSDVAGHFKAQHVPFKGAAEAANAIIGGQVQFLIGVMGSLVPLVAAGKLRALAVTTRTRMAQVPQVPTMIEAGVPDFVFESWGGLAAPAGTPDAVVARLNQVLPGVMASAAMKDLMDKTGSVASYLAPQPFVDQIARNIAIDKVLVKRLGMLTPQ